MRMMMKVKLDTEAGSRGLQDGSLPQVMQETLGQLKPEAAYFGPEGGLRTAFIVFDLEDPSQLPSISEPLFRLGKGTHRDVPGNEPGGPAEGPPTDQRRRMISIRRLDLGSFGAD